MPTPEFEWKSYDVPAGDGGVDGLEAVAEMLTVELPDLTKFPQPHDKAKILLETAAEVEHALLAQYLYAALSLRTEDEDPAKQTALSEWFAEVHRIARQEMGHLMTVQNLLLAIGLPPNLEREDFPPRKDLYPFKLHLEPFSQRSLAKYVAAEAPVDATGIGDIIHLATQSAGAMVNHVGTIYGLLGVMFSIEAEIAAGGSASPAWDANLRRLAAAAHQQSPADSWHLSDGAIDTETLKFQGTKDNWPGGGVTIHQIPDRAAAREAIRDVAEQGEGPTNGGEESHFERFRTIYRGDGDLPPFPAADGWLPARAVPTDPKPQDISEARTRRWAQLADLRYGLLLGLIEHYLRTADVDDRANLSRWAVEEMFNISSLAGQLATLPQGGGVAALPFTLPTSPHLPGTDNERWAVQRDRTTGAITHTQQMLADAADANDPTLMALVDGDTARLDLMHGGGEPPQPTTSFARDILPLFRPVDIDHMNGVGLNLADFEAVRSAATSISKRLKGIGGRRMPPPPAPPLTADQISLFDTWVTEGSPP